MKQLTILVIATLVLGTVLMGCDSGPEPQTAEEREMAEGRRSVGDPVAPPGPPDASMLPDTDAPKPADD